MKSRQQTDLNENIVMQEYSFNCAYADAYARTQYRIRNEILRVLAGLAARSCKRSLTISYHRINKRKRLVK